MACYAGADGEGDVNGGWCQVLWFPTAEDRERREKEDEKGRGLVTCCARGGGKCVGLGFSFIFPCFILIISFTIFLIFNTCKNKTK